MILPYLLKVLRSKRLMRFYKSPGQIQLNRLLAIRISEYIHFRGLSGDVSVLHIGCGLGELECRLADNPWIGSVDSVDSDLNMVQNANRRVDSQVLREKPVLPTATYCAHRGIWAVLPTPGLFYDVLVCQGEQSLVEDEKKFTELLKEYLYRHLKPGGLLLFVLPKKTSRHFWLPNTQTLRVLLPSFNIDEVGTDRIIRKMLPRPRADQRPPELIHLEQAA